MRSSGASLATGWLLVYLVLTLWMLSSGWRRTWPVSWPRKLSWAWWLCEVPTLTMERYLEETQCYIQAGEYHNPHIWFFFPHATVWSYQTRPDTLHLTLSHSVCRVRANEEGTHQIIPEWTPPQDLSQWVFILWWSWRFCFGLLSVAKGPGLSVTVVLLTSQGSAPKVAPPLDQLQLSTSLCGGTVVFSSLISFWLRSSGQFVGWGVCRADQLFTAGTSDTHNSHRSGWKDHRPCNAQHSSQWPSPSRVIILKLLCFVVRRLLWFYYPWLHLHIPQIYWIKDKRIRSSTLSLLSLHCH